HNVSPYTEGLSTLSQIKPVWFQYNGKAGIEDTEKRYVGVIAQDMQKAMPHTVRTINYEDEATGEKTDYLEFDPSALDFMLINSVKELAATVEDLKKEMETLKAENKALRNEINRK
ncbi:MAG: tail fiber domain-containing protein, partial [Bacteroidota bacterium]